MNTRTEITCHCGHRIVHKDVLQKGQFLRLFSPSFIYVKYRCSHCKRLGERFVPEEQWDETFLREVPAETTREERRRFDRMGDIDLDEVMDFHSALQSRPLKEILDPSDPS